MTPVRPSPPRTGPAARQVDLGQLLAACVSAVRRSCRVIREVQLEREAGGTIQEAYKDDANPRSAVTIADLRAQSVIVNPLLKQFPGLKIVAEEDQDAPVGHDVDASVAAGGDCEGIVIPESLRTLCIEDVCVFCDPLDGTFEFVEGRLHAVQSLVGISVRGEPIAGVIGQPFCSEEPIYGVVGAGVVNLVQEPASRSRRGGLVLASSRSSPKGILKEAMDVIAPADVVKLGASGNKILHVAKGAVDMCILNLGTSLWDTAATTAIVRALGGTVTDLFGNPIRHFAHSRLANCYGVLVSGSQLSANDVNGRTHQDICTQLRQSQVLDPWLQEAGLRPRGQPQATDIALDLDGNPISAHWLSEVLGTRVLGYAADESSATRYLMSNTCRLKLSYPEAASKGPESVFLKRVVMQDLEHVKLKAQTAPTKLERDVTSYLVEASFLSSAVCQKLREADLRIPRSYNIDSRPAALDGSPIESKFLSLLEDFSPEAGWHQSGLLNKEELICALNSLALLHAFFWDFKASPMYKETCDSIWDQATYWVPKRQAADSFEKLPRCWAKQRANFGPHLDEVKFNDTCHVPLEALGNSLAECAPACAENVHNVGLDPEHPHRTVIHGDAKAANFFFRSSNEVSPSTGETDTLQVGIIDFQWCGWGHPSVDVAYLIASSASPDLLSNDGSAEEFWLQTYYSKFCESLVKTGKVPDTSSAEKAISFQDLKKYYDDALIDLARLVISYHWDRIKASPDILESRKGMLGSNSYNKDLQCALWLISRTASLLARKKVSGSESAIATKHLAGEPV